MSFAILLVEFLKSLIFCSIFEMTTTGETFGMEEVVIVSVGSKIGGAEIC